MANLLALPGCHQKTVHIHAAQCRVALSRRTTQNHSSFVPNPGMGGRLPFTFLPSSSEPPHQGEDNMEACGNQCKFWQLTG